MVDRRREIFYKGGVFPVFACPTISGRQFCWLWVALFLLGRPVWGANTANTADYLLEVWNSENGLPDSSVTAVAQTPDGYLWVGTYNGLVRFDGVRFVTFDPANTPALSHARVRRLSVDNRGVLWISSYDGALTRFQNGVFTWEGRFVRAAEGEVAFVAALTNQLVFLTSRGELLRKTLSAPAGEGWEDLPPPARGIGALCCADGSGTLWYRDGDKHLWRLQASQFVPLPETAGLAGRSVNCLTTDARGRLWVGTDIGFAVWDGRGFQSAVPGSPAQPPLDVETLTVTETGQIWALANGGVCAAADGRWLVAPQAGRVEFPLATGRVFAQEDHRGGVWLFNYGGGLIHVGADGQSRQMTLDDGFPGDRVYCLFEDQEGDWWAGLDAMGLVRVRARQFHAVPAVEKAPAKAARSVCEDARGRVWIGRLSGGLNCWQEGDFTNYPVGDNASANSVFCVCPDAQGRLWISGGDEDLWLRDQGELRRVLPTIHRVKSLLADSRGRIWVGTTTGLFVSEPGSPGGFQPFKGLPHRTVRALTEGLGGVVWGGTGNGELFCIASNAVSLFRPDDADASAVWSVLADGDGTVWAGTFRGGLLRWRNGVFTRYGRRNELPDEVISQMLDDRRGNLWLGSHQGVFRVAKADLNQLAGDPRGFVSCVTYGRSDGLPSLECSGGYQPAAWRDQAGRLWFTTARGAAWIQSDEVRANPKPPPVVIEGILVDGRLLELPATNAALVIPPGRHQIELHYTGLSLASPERVQFRYQLAPLDADWVEAGTRRTAQYGFLPPGHYRFQVLAGNSDGVWNQTGSTLVLTIRRHYYETWWFQTLGVLLVLGAVAGGVRQAATRRLRRKMEELERKQMVERERARIAKDIHDDLGASLTLIAVLGDLARREKTAERIEKMSSTARAAVKSLDEIVWAVNPRNDTLANLVDYTGQFATDYLREAGIRCRLDVPEHTPAREVPANVRHNVFLVVKEALQNIVKHAHATEVWLRINTGERSLSLSVEDNGCGFEHPPEDAWADGLRNMRQRLAEVGGECRIASQVNVGTTITVALPLPG